MPSKSGWIAFTVIFIAILGWSVYRDIHIEQQYTSDLRNRVVGARLEKDHASPYYYTWKPGDRMRYYDPSNQQEGDSMQLSNITGTPFLHQLMIPLADLPQRTISYIWLILEYLVFAACVIIALGLADSRQQKAMVLAGAAVFLLTEAWKSHIANGQYYLFIPFLALLFYRLIRNPHHVLNAAGAGLCAIILVLIRPNTLIFFLPFLLVIRKYPIRYITSFFVPIVLLTGWSLASPWQRSLWQDYRKFLGENIKLHQSLDVNAPPGETASYYADWEGWRQSDIDKSHAQHPYTAHSENGNVFVLFNKITHIKTNVTILNATSVLVLLLLSGFFLWYKRKEGYNDPGSIAIFAFCLYMVSDLFSPVWRHQYYTLQWLCPVLLAAAAFNPGQRKWFILLGLALVLNILNIPFIKMEHTIGEYMMLIILLFLSIARPPQISNTGKP